MTALFNLIPLEWLIGVAAAIAGAAWLAVRGWLNRRRGAADERQRARETDRRRADETYRDLDDVLRNNDGQLHDDDTTGYRD